MSDHRNDIAEVIGKIAQKHFTNYVFVGWQTDDKWVLTVHPGVDRERLTYLRDFLTREIDKLP